jgi:hypothetical protein
VGKGGCSSGTKSRANEKGSGPAADPDRAARLLGNAGRIANSLTDESAKASALSGVAEALAATDPASATHWY